MMALSVMVMALGLLPTAPPRVGSRFYRHRAYPRASLVQRGNASDALTIGDVLLSVASQQLAALPEEEQLDRTGRTIDAMLADSSAQLDAVSKVFDLELDRVADNATRVLRQEMLRTEGEFNAKFNATVAAIDTVFAPTRASVQAELSRHREEQAAKLRAKRLERENHRAFAGTRNVLTRTRPAVVPSPSAPKHPVVATCEAAAAVFSVMLLIAAADFSSSRHQLTSPAHIASTRLLRPQRTAMYARPRAECAGWGPECHAPEHVATVPSSTDSDGPVSVAQTRSVREGAGWWPQLGAREWWTAMRSDLMLWFVSFSVIVLRSGTDEWAARALGLEPIGADAPGVEWRANASAPASPAALVRWEYDWARDVWREVPSSAISLRSATNSSS